MDEDSTAVAAAIAGFILGATFLEASEGFARVLISFGTLGAFIGAAIAGLRGTDVAGWGAIGGGAGLIFGAIFVLMNLLIGA